MATQWLSSLAAIDFVLSSTKHALLKSQDVLQRAVASPASQSRHWDSEEATTRNPQPLDIATRSLPIGLTPECSHNLVLADEQFPALSLTQDLFARLKTFAEHFHRGRGLECMYDTEIRSCQQLIKKTE